MADAREVARRIILEEYKLTPADVNGHDDERITIDVKDAIKSIANAYEEGYADGLEDGDEPDIDIDIDIAKRRKGA